MNFTDFVPFIAIATALLAGLLWMIKAQISLQKEFRPNGGGGGGANAGSPIAGSGNAGGNAPTGGMASQPGGGAGGVPTGLQDTITGSSVTYAVGGSVSAAGGSTYGSGGTSPSAGVVILAYRVS